MRRKATSILMILIYLASTAISQGLKLSYPKTLGRGSLRGISCSKDGRFLVAFTTAGTLLYRIEDLSEIAHIPSNPFSAAFSPNGDIIAIGEKDGSISLWQIEGMERISTLEGHSDEVTALCFSPDGKLLASGGWKNDNAVFIWDVGEEKRIAVLKGHAGGINDLKFSSDGKLLASVSFLENLICIWETKGWRKIDVKRGISATFSPDGRLLATGGDHRDKKIHIWDLIKGEEIATLQGHVGNVTALDFSPDGLILASGGGVSGRIWDGRIRIWDLKGMEERRTLKSGDYIRSLFFTPDGKLICHSLERGLSDVVYVWDIKTGKLIGAIRGFTNGISSLAFSPDGRVLAGSVGNEIYLWNPLSGEEIGRLRVFGKVNDIAFEPGGEILAVGVASADSPLQIWDTERGKLEAIPRGHVRPVYSVAFSPDGKLLASCGSDGMICLWEPIRWRRIASLRGHPGAVLSLAFSPDGKLLASGGGNGTIVLWNIERKEELKALKGHSVPISALAFDPKGELLASGGWLEDRGELRLWDQEWRMIFDFKFKGIEGVTSLAFNRWGDLLATGHKDGTIQIWDVSRKRAIEKLKVDDQMVTVVLFSPGGSMLAVGELDGLVKMWRLGGRYPVRPGRDFLTTWGTVKGRMLHQNFPNPFNMETWIPCLLSGGERLEIYDLSGGLVRRIDLSGLPPGRHLVRWDGRNDSGEEVSSGVYFITLIGDGFSKSLKALVVR